MKKNKCTILSISLLLIGILCIVAKMWLLPKYLLPQVEAAQNELLLLKYTCLTRLCFGAGAVSIFGGITLYLSYKHDDLI